MNFKNRLEALKWMCENPEKKVYFDPASPKMNETYIRIYSNGNFASSNGIEPFNNPESTNFRTTPEYIPDPKPEPEFEWPRSIGASDVVSPIDGSQLFRYHNALIEFLDRRFVRK